VPFPDHSHFLAGQGAGVEKYFLDSTLKQVLQLFFICRNRNLRET